MQNFMLRVLACALSIGLALNAAPASAADPASAATLYGSIKAVSGELRELADDAITAGDQVLYNRIEQAINGLALLITRLEPVIRKGEAAANEVVNNASREMLAILSELHIDGASAGNYASAKLNLSLANASALLAAVPLVDVPPTVFAISPTRIDADQRGRQIRVFGYLPGDVNDDVEIFVNDRLVSAKRGAGGSIAFKIPTDLVLKPEAEVAVRIKASEEYGPFNLLWKTHVFDETVLVGLAKPFTCNVASYVENPDYLQSVTAPGHMEFDASTQGGRNNANENRTVNVDDLFVATMGAAAREYDVSTAVIENAGFKFQRWGQCGGKGPSGKVEVLSSGKSVRVALHAPHLSRNVLKGCDAGGTHAKATLQPTFLVARKNAHVLKLVKTDTFRLGAAGLDLTYPMPPAGPWSLHTKCAFKEASESWMTRTMVLTTQDRQETARGLVARIVDDRLLIEPLDPMRFDDQLR